MNYSDKLLKTSPKFPALRIAENKTSRANESGATARCFIACHVAIAYAIGTYDMTLSTFPDGFVVHFTDKTFALKIFLLTCASLGANPALNLHSNKNEKNSENELSSGRARRRKLFHAGNDLSRARDAEHFAVLRAGIFRSS